MRPNTTAVLRVCVLLAACARMMGEAAAQVPTTIKTDASWGRTPNVLAPAAGPANVTANRGSYPIAGSVYAIPQTLGKVAGANLFHSFDTFNVGSGDAAVFTTTSSFNNVISRVSGASPSIVQGLLALVPAAGSKPAFFFINPNGIAFTTGSQIDVPAAFHASTANELRFSDGTIFRAAAGSDSNFTTAPPAAFGFLGTTRAPIVIDSGKSIVMTPGSLLNVIGGDVLLDHTLLVNQGGGDVRVGAVGSGAAQINLTGALPALHGEIDIVAAGGIAVTSLNGADSGSVAVSAGDIFIDGRDGGGIFTGISSIVMLGPAKPGDIVVNATGTLSMTYAGILSDSYSSTSDAGAISIHAATLLIDGQGQGSAIGVLGRGVQQGISSSTYDAAGSARTGAITVNVDRDLTFLHRGKIYSGSGSAGVGGPVKVTAGSIAGDARGDRQFFTGIASITAGPAGGSGDLEVAASGALSLRNGAQIQSGTFAGGTPGAITVSARSMDLDGDERADQTKIARQGAPGSAGAPRDVTIDVLEDISIERGASIVSDAYIGRAGSIRVHAGSITIDGRGTEAFTGISSDAHIGQFADAGDLDIDVAGRVSVNGGARISSSTFSSGAAGTLKLHAGSLTLDGSGNPASTEIGSAATPHSAGNAGLVDIVVDGVISIVNGATLSSTTFSTGNAGTVSVHAGSLFIDRRDSPHFTGIASASAPQASGDAGVVRVTVDGDASLVHFGAIASDTLSDGNAGTVSVAVNGKLSLRGGAGIASSTFAGGNAGSVDVVAGSIAIDDENLNVQTGINAAAGFPSLGHAGEVHVTALGDLSMVNGGVIGSFSNSRMDAGRVRVEAQNISIAGQGRTDGNGILGLTTDAGSAGNVQVIARGTLSLRGDAGISSASTGTGRAGSVQVEAQDIVMDGVGMAFPPGIQALSIGEHSGDAGDVSVIATGSLTMRRGSFISASTFSPDGRSGSVAVGAGILLLDGANTQISAAARAGSSGQTGAVKVHASKAITLNDSAELSISNEADFGQPRAITPTLLSVSAPEITLSNNAKISAQASGAHVAASDIEIHFEGRLVVDPSSITTSAKSGNGGSIWIDGSGAVVLDHSQITTSAGSAGDGGDITIRANALVMNGGFIQANTKAVGARGGNVAIDVQALIPTGGAVVIGGSAPLVFQPDTQTNVIQAAAPTGVSGTVDVSTPVTDISGSLRALSVEVISFGALGKDLCRVGARSSLTPVGRGGVPATAAKLLRPDSAAVIAARVSAQQPRIRVARGEILSRCAQ